MSTITISDRAIAVQALNAELSDIEAQQIKLASEMAQLIAKQAQLSSRASALNQSLEKLLHNERTQTTYQRP